MGFVSFVFFVVSSERLTLPFALISERHTKTRQI